MRGLVPPRVSQQRDALTPGGPMDHNTISRYAALASLVGYNNSIVHTKRDTLIHGSSAHKYILCNERRFIFVSPRENPLCDSCI